MNAKDRKDLLTLANSMHQSFESLTTKLNAIDKTVSNIEVTVDGLKTIAERSDRTLRGTNGDAGLVAQVNSLSEDVTELKASWRPNCEIEEVVLLLHGDPSDDKSKGLVHEVQELAKTRETRKKYIAVIVAASLVALVDLLLHAVPTILNALFRAQAAGG